MPRVERAKLAAFTRWGPPRRLNIGDLTHAQREVVLGLIEAQRIANASTMTTAPAVETPGAVSAEGHSHDPIA